MNAMSNGMRGKASWIYATSSCKRMIQLFARYQGEPQGIMFHTRFKICRFIGDGKDD